MKDHFFSLYKRKEENFFSQNSILHTINLPSRKFVPNIFLQHLLRRVPQTLGLTNSCVMESLRQKRVLQIDVEVVGRTVDVEGILFTVFVIVGLLFASVSPVSLSGKFCPSLRPVF